MPPIKTYVFQDITSEYYTITIKTYSFEQAMTNLVRICKHPSDYKLISEH